MAELPSDKTAKAYIAANSAEINKTTGVSIFIGDVKIDHGSTHVTADKVTTYTDQNNHVIKAIAIGLNGNLATYQTLNDPKNPPLIAKAQTIQYFPPQHYVILIGDAVVTQGKDSITGQHLEYDLTKKLLLTKPNIGEKTGRTQIVIQPDDVNNKGN
jgi:lipopolysaccharide export system protein LptA